MGFSIRKTKSKRTFTYTGDLQKAIEQAEKELAERQGSQERVFLLWQYERAKKAYEKYEVILSILVYTFFSRMFDLMLPPVAKHSIVVA